MAEKDNKKPEVAKTKLGCFCGHSGQVLAVFITRPQAGANRRNRQYSVS
jgi:hypothetical protein